jgi:hypothetical protein
VDRLGFRLLAALPVAAVALAGLACEVTVSGGPYSVHEERRFPVTGAPDLRLATFDGSIVVRSWDRNEVLVDVERQASDKARAGAIRVSAAQSGNAVTVEVLGPNNPQAALGFGVRPSARLVVSVPAQTNLVARTGDGSITVERVTGRIDLDSGDGSLRGIELSGSVRARTADGSIHFDRVSGAFDLDSGDGGVRLTGRLQSVRLHTGDGLVEVRATEGSSMTDDWEIDTGDGSLRVELPASFGAMLDARTGDGAVRVRGFGEPPSTGRHRGENRELKLQLGSGGRLLRLRTNSGSISVRTL